MSAFSDFAEAARIFSEAVASQGVSLEMRREEERWLRAEMGALQRGLSTDRQITNDKLDAVHRDIDELSKKLDQLLRLLGTNGSGGHG